MEKQWFNKQVKDVETELGTDLEKGLSSSQVEAHKNKYGLYLKNLWINLKISQ